MRTPSRNPRGVEQFHRHVKVILLIGAKCLFLDGERVIASALPIAVAPNRWAASPSHWAPSDRALSALRRAHEHPSAPASSGANCDGSRGYVLPR